jgi:hypothetical protein
MRKFSKLNESVKVNINEVNSILSELKGFTYNVYDYYYSMDSKSRIELIKDEKDLKEGSYYSNLIILESESSSSRVDITDWVELDFSMSGFNFYDTNIVNLYTTIFGLLEKFKQHSPKLCIKEGRFLILLIGEKVSESLMTLKEDLTKAYRKLNILLTDLNHVLRAKDNDIIQEITFWTQFNRLIIDFYDQSSPRYRINPDRSMSFISLIDLLESRTLSVLASLCTQLQNLEGYEWIKDQEKIPEYEEIREEINDLGFHIRFKNLSKSQGGWMNSSYQLIIYEI